MVLENTRIFVLIILVIAFVCRRVQVNQDGLKLHGTFQLLVYVDVNINGMKRMCYEGNAEALLVASKEIGLEVNADKTTYMVMSGDQNAG